MKPGKKYNSRDNGVYNILVWHGEGRFDGHAIAAGDFLRDELLVSHPRATVPITVENTGREDLMIIKFFGPDINPNVPKIPHYGSWEGARKGGG